MNGEGWAFACWLVLFEGGYIPPGHGWQCGVCRYNWYVRNGL